MPSTRRFDGTDLETLLATVRAELGDDVTITEANRVRSGGFGGFFAKETFEVVVEVPDSPVGDHGARQQPQALPEPARSILDLVEQASNAESAATTSASRSEGFEALLARSAGWPAPPTESTTDELAAQWPAANAITAAEQTMAVSARYESPRHEPTPLVNGALVRTPERLSQTASAQRAADAFERAAVAAEPVPSRFDEAEASLDDEPEPFETLDLTDCPRLISVARPEPADFVEASGCADLAPTGELAVDEPIALRSEPHTSISSETPPAASPICIEVPMPVVPTLAPTRSHPSSHHTGFLTAVSTAAEDITVFAPTMDPEPAPPMQAMQAMQAMPSARRQRSSSVPSARTTTLAVPTRGERTREVEQFHLAQLGLPEDLLSRSMSLGNVQLELAHLFESLPRMPECPIGLGSVVAVIGERDAALELANQLADELDANPEEIVLVSTSYKGRAIPAERRITDRRDAEARKLAWRRRRQPTLVAVEAPVGGLHRPTTAWAAQMLDVIEPVLAWGAVEALRKSEDIEAWSIGLGGLDALAVSGFDATESPASVLGVGLPVGRMDGRVATAAAWVDLLSARLAA